TVTDLRRWPPEDLEMLTGLIVDHMLLTAAAILDAPDRPAAQRRVIEIAGKRLRLIVLGSRHWLDPAG
ncbi:MAG TPA: hypothetical protein VFR67_22780, partial [Pilimelia sp.]|nr:hypothetical protein [Pilimelia sp.]